MVTKRTALVTILLLGSIDLARAQGVPTGSGAQEGSASNHQQAKSGGGKSQAAPSASVALGWNFVHATNCNMVFDGFAHTLIVYPQEGGTWSTTDTDFQNILEPQCSQGNWIAFFVFDQFGDWNQIFTYSFR
jgi:hypothetical protein